MPNPAPIVSPAGSTCVGTVDSENVAFSETDADADSGADSGARIVEEDGPEAATTAVCEGIADSLASLELFVPTTHRAEWTRKIKTSEKDQTVYEVAALMDLNADVIFNSAHVAPTMSDALNTPFSAMLAQGEPNNVLNSFISGLSPHCV